MLTQILVTALIAQFSIQPNDVIVVYGDSQISKSITVSALEESYGSRHPGSNVQWIPVGHPGRDAAFLAAHVGTPLSVPAAGQPVGDDVCLFSPTKVMIQSGWNDVNATTYVNSITALVNKLELSPMLGGCGLTASQILLLGPSPAEQKSFVPGGASAAITKNALLLAESNAEASYAASAGISFVDIYHYLEPIYNTATATVPLFKWCSDGGHNNWSGAKGYATAVLVAIGDTAGISDASITVGGSVSCTGCTISSTAGDGLTSYSFFRLDTGVPFFFPATGQSLTILGTMDGRYAIRWLPAAIAQNHLGLQVAGLAAGNWRVSMWSDATRSPPESAVSGYVRLGEWTATQLAAGIDLGQMPENLTQTRPDEVQDLYAFGKTDARLGFGRKGLFDAGQVLTQLIGAIANHNQGAITAYMTTAEIYDLARPGGPLAAALLEWVAKVQAWRLSWQAYGAPLNRHYMLTKI